MQHSAPRKLGAINYACSGAKRKRTRYQPAVLAAAIDLCISERNSHEGGFLGAGNAKELPPAERLGCGAASDDCSRPGMPAASTRAAPVLP